MKTVVSGLVITSLLLAASASHAQTNRQRGTVWGGLTGAAAGAIIGENSDEAGAGAAIGGVVGAIAGGVLGNAKDQDYRNYQAAQQYQYSYQVQRAVSIPDVIAMTHNRVSDSVIITSIQQHGLQRQLEVSDIVNLSHNGVSDHVIRAMQNAGSGPGYIATVPTYTPPVRVATPRVYRAYPAPCPHYRCHGPVYMRY